MTANLKTPARKAGIECLRGLAIVLVIVHHLALPFRLPLRPSLLGEWLPKRLLSAISFNGHEAVFLFFVISGFLITSRIAARDGDIGRVARRGCWRCSAACASCWCWAGPISSIGTCSIRRCTCCAWGHACCCWRFMRSPLLLRRGLRWLAAMGRMSYELYLSHMFIVLATVAACRALLGSQQAWTFAVYLPVLACCYALARQLERGTARILSPR